MIQMKTMMVKRMKECVWHVCVHAGALVRCGDLGQCTVKGEGLR